MKFNNAEMDQGYQRPRKYNSKRNSKKRYNNKYSNNLKNSKKKKKSIFAKILEFFKIKPSNKTKKYNSKTYKYSRNRSYKGYKNKTKHEPSICKHEKLFIGNLSYDVVNEDLKDLLKGIGIVKSAEIIFDKRTQRSKGFAFVEMQSIEDAQRAVDELGGKDFMGRRLVVDSAKNI